MKQQTWLVPILLAFGLPLTHAQSALSGSPFADQVNEEEAVSLSPFDTTSTRVGEYNVTDSGMNRVNRALIDTPHSIQVVTSEFMEHIGAGSLYEAAQYLSGMSAVEAGNDARDDRVIRGFTGGGVFYDGFTFGSPMESEILDRVEIVKGPSLYTVTNNAGGSGTGVIKSPKFKAANKFKVEVADQYAGNKASFDSTGAVPGSERFAYRLIGTYRDAKSYVPGRTQMKTLSPMLTWKISDKSQLKFKGYFSNWGQEGVLASGVSYLPVRDDFPYGTGATISKADIAPGYVPFEQNGRPDWAIRGGKYRLYMAEFTTPLTRQLDLRLAVLRSDEYEINAGAGVDISRTTPPRNIGQIDPHTGRETPNYYWTRQDTTQPWHEQNNPYIPIYMDPTTNISRVQLRAPNPAINKRGIMNYQADLTGKFDFGGSPSAPLFTLHGIAGSYWQVRDKGFEKSYEDYSEDITAIYDPTWPFMPNPRPPTRPTPPPALTLNRNWITENRVWYYANTQIDTFRKRLILGAGVRYYKYAAENFNFVNNAYRNDTQSKSSPSFAALFKITPDASIYVAYAENTSRGTYYAGDAQPARPIFQNGQQQELGVKMYFFNRRVSASASYYELEKTNLSTNDPRDVIEGRNGVNRLYPSVLNDITNEGFEFDISGKITKNLNILGSITKQKYRNDGGYRQRNTPDTLYNGFIRYGFSSGTLKGLSLNLGVKYAGASPGHNPSINPTVLGVRNEYQFFLPSRTLLDAGAGYTWGKVSFRLNINNLLDEDKPYTAVNRQGVRLVPPRNVRLTTTINF